MKLIELFSGVGTQRQAFEDLYGKEIETIGISEIDNRAITAYNILHGDTLNFGDITKIESLPDANIWTYSFPCTDLSIAGKKKGFEGKKSSLLFQVERLLTTSNRPKILIMENVSNLLSSTFINDFKKWLERLKSFGYITTYEKIKAFEYGGVSIRNRVFAVSILNEEYIFPDKTGTNLVVKDILDPVQESNLIDNTIFYEDKKEDYTKAIKLGEYGRGGQGYGIYSINGLALTLTATGGGRASSGGGLYARPEGIYKLGATEMIKVMGWDDEIAKKLSSNLSQAKIGFLMGNAIDLKVMRKIAEGLEKHLN